MWARRRESARCRESVLCTDFLAQPVSVRHAYPVSDHHRVWVPPIHSARTALHQLRISHGCALTLDELA